MGFSSDATTAAAARMSSSQDTLSKGKRGQVDQDAIWLTERGRLARAIVADPDIVFYYVWLCTNRLRVLVMQVEDLLEEMIIGAEGKKFEQPVASTDSSALSRVVQTSTSVVSEGGAPDSALISQITSTANSYIKRSLLPNISSNGRLQVKGAEAESKYSTAKASVLKLWPDVLQLKQQCSRSSLVTPTLLKSEALQVPLANLQTAAETTWDSKSASAYTLQVIAGIAAVQAMDVTIDMSSRTFWADYLTLSKALNSVSLPSMRQLGSTIAGLEGATAAETRDLSEYLGALAAQLDRIGTDAQVTLDRQDAEVATPTATIAAILLAFDPGFSSATKKAAKSSLDIMRNNHFDYAEKLLLEGYVDGVMQMQIAQQASYIGQVMLSTGSFAASLASRGGPRANRT